MLQFIAYAVLIRSNKCKMGVFIVRLPIESNLSSTYLSVHHSLLQFAGEHYMSSAWLWAEFATSFFLSSNHFVCIESWHIGHTNPFELAYFEFRFITFSLVIFLSFRFMLRKSKSNWFILTKNEKLTKRKH